MKAVLIIVLLLVAGGAIYYATTEAKKEVVIPRPDNIPTESTEAKKEVVIPRPDNIPTESTEKNVLYIDPDLPNRGIPAPGEPEFQVDVQLVPKGKQKDFHITVTEAHGWAADGLYVDISYEGLKIVPNPKIPPARIMRVLCNSGILDFNSKLVQVSAVASADFPELPADGYGTSENWKGKVVAFSHLTAPKPGA